MVSSDKNTELKVEKPELYFWLCQLFSVTSGGSVCPYTNQKKNLLSSLGNFDTSVRIHTYYYFSSMIIYLHYP